VGALLTAAALASSASAATYVTHVPATGSGAIHGGVPGSPAFQDPEFPGGAIGADPDAKVSVRHTSVINRRLSHGVGLSQIVGNTPITPNWGGQPLSFDGLDHFDQRTASNGNQFSGEPPDQGLCAGNGYVMETINSAIRVYRSNGTPASGVAAFNEFYGYPPAINRTTGRYGPFMFDPSCMYDRGVNRWFHVTDTLAQDPATGDFTGRNWLDLAVSRTGNPLGAWTFYRIPLNDDGTQGQPNHHCDGGPCFGDYPHIGADSHGVYITTNEYSFFGDQYTTAQIYALSKDELAAGSSNPQMAHIDDTGVAGTPGFTVWPAISSGAHDLRANGTEWFLSSMAAEEAGGTGTDNRIGVWALTNTASLDTPHPNVVLRSSVVQVSRYGIPPSSQQRPGSTPLRTCLNNTTLETPFGLGCWQWFFEPGEEPPHNQALQQLDSNDTRMQQVSWANGALWGALDTGVGSSTNRRAGIAWYAIQPALTAGHVHGSVLRQGTLAVANANVTYPAIGVLPNGRGAMTFTLVGPGIFPSAAWAPLSVSSGVGAVHIAGHGAGPQDGFAGYRAFGDPPRPRWGDYGATAVVGDGIWIASEYIGQTCSFQRYLVDTPSSPMFTCGNTRTSLANWGTRISLIRP
jgi:hypothetical protein